MKDYIELAIRTESGRFPLDDGRCDPDLVDASRLLHAGMGMVDEAAEFLSPIKAHLYYGKPLDKVNLKEELGDLLWFMAIAMDVFGTDFDTEMARNINKLRTRYPDKFDSGKAVTRDLDAERSTLEGI